MTFKVTTRKMQKLIIIGAGGYAKSVIDSMNLHEYWLCGFIDEYSQKKEHLGFPIFGKRISDIENPKEYKYFIAIGDNTARKKWYDILKSYDLELITVIDKTAIVSCGSILGEGTFVGKLAIVNNDVHVGNNCVINTKALIEHGSRVYNHVNVSTNASINGDVQIMEGVFVGSSSVLNGQITINEWSTVGSGAVVVRDVEARTTVVGVPAKNIIYRKNKSGE